MKTKLLLMGTAALFLNGCVVEPVPDRAYAPGPGYAVATVEPYYFSATYCAGCWYGQWGGRTGYHRGGGRPWEGKHAEVEHHREDRGRDVEHEGHR
jgi:hypothetical protein